MASYPAYLLERMVAPATEPLTLAEAKLFLRVDGSSEDSMITDMIEAVREAAEEYLQKSLMTQTWCITLDDYAPSHAKLPMGPVQSISSVMMLDRDDNSTAVNSNYYVLNARKDEVQFESAVVAHQVQITYVAGFGDAAEVPAAIRQGMLMHLAALYHDRIAGIEIPESARGLYQPYRVVRL